MWHRFMGRPVSVVGRPVCWFQTRGGCDGRMDRAHFLPKQAIKKQYPYGVMRREHDGLIAACQRGEQYISGGVPWEPVSLDLVVWDERCWTWMCRKHHSDFDAHLFRIARTDLPACLEEYAAEHFLMSRLDHDFGRLDTHDDHLYC